MATLVTGIWFALLGCGKAKSDQRIQQLETEVQQLKEVAGKPGLVEPARQRLPVIDWSEEQLYAEFGKPEFTRDKGFGLYNQNPLPKQLPYALMITIVRSKVAAIGYFPSYTSQRKALTEDEIGVILRANGKEWQQDQSFVNHGQQFREWFSIKDGIRAEIFPDNRRLYVWNTSYEKSDSVQTRDYGDPTTFRPHYLDLLKQ